jgi:predicted ATPase with chaperone activity
MLARRRTTILPAMTLGEAIETTRMHRVAGLTDGRMALVTTRRCRAPHHPISGIGLIGGGQVPLPGEVSLAHHGIVLLDEWPAFKRHVLEVLRQPLEKRITRIPSRIRRRSPRTGHDRPASPPPLCHMADQRVTPLRNLLRASQVQIR